MRFVWWLNDSDGCPSLGTGGADDVTVMLTALDTVVAPAVSAARAVKLYVPAGTFVASPNVNHKHACNVGLFELRSSFGVDA